MNTIKEKRSITYLVSEPLFGDGSQSSLLPLRQANQDKIMWGVWGALGLLLFNIIAMLFLTGIAVFGYVLATGAVFDESLMTDPAAIVVSLVAVVPAHLLTIVLAWLLVTRIGKIPFGQAIGWHRRRYFGFWSCLLIALVLLAASALVVLAFGNEENDLQRVLMSSRTAVYLVAIIAAFSAPFVEELIYRGVLYPAFERKFGAWAAAAIVTAVFAAVHVPQYLPSYGAIFAICLVSLVLTIIRARADSLLPCFIIHTVFNGIQSCLLVLEPFLPTIAGQSDVQTGFITILFY